MLGDHLRRLAMFNLVGMAGFAVQITGIACLTRVFGWHHVPATALAMQTVIVQNYLVHSRWTWADRAPATRRERFVRPVRYQAATTLSLVLNVALTALFVSRSGLAPELANMGAVCACALINYAAAGRLVFRAGSPHA